MPPRLQGTSKWNGVFATPMTGMPSAFAACAPRPGWPRGRGWRSRPRLGDQGRRSEPARPRCTGAPALAVSQARTAPLTVDDEGRHRSSDVVVVDVNGADLGHSRQRYELGPTSNAARSTKPGTGQVAQNVSTPFTSPASPAPERANRIGVLVAASTCWNGEWCPAECHSQQALIPKSSDRVEGLWTRWIRPGARSCPGPMRGRGRGRTW